MPVMTATGAPPSELWQELEHKFGFNPEIDIFLLAAATQVDIWDNGGVGAVPVYPWPAAAAATTVQSDDADDDGAPEGPGMHELTVVGIADSTTFAEVTQTVTLNGVGAVALPIDLFRVNRMFGVGAGDAAPANASNVGTITAQHGATVISQINPARGQTLQAIYTLPQRTGFTRCALWAFTFSISRQIDVSGIVILQTRAPGANQCWRVRGIGGVHSKGTSWYNRELSPPGIVLPVGTDIRSTVVECTTNDTAFSGSFDMVFSP